MKSKHRKTLEAIFKRPTSGGIVFSDVEALVQSLGGDVREGDGSRIALELNGRCEYMHHPHPGKDAKKYQVEAIRQRLTDSGVTP